MSAQTVCPKCGHADPLRPRGLQEQADEIARLKRQRDALFAAAVAVQNQHNPRSESGDQLRAAIAKVQP